MHERLLRKKRDARQNRGILGGDMGAGKDWARKEREKQN